MPNFLKMLEAEVSAWPSISIHPHRFGGREFRFRSAEVGHVHTGGIVDIPFPRSVRDALLADDLAEKQPLGPEFGLDHFPNSQRRRSQARRLAYALVIPALRTEDRNRSTRAAGIGK
jgi:hypothetical protein